MQSIGDTYLGLYITTGIAATFCDIPTLHTGNTATFPVLMHMSFAAGSLNLIDMYMDLLLVFQGDQTQHTTYVPKQHCRKCINTGIVALENVCMCVCVRVCVCVCVCKCLMTSLYVMSSCQ